MKLLTLFALLTAIIVGHAAEYHVRQDGTGDFTTIQAGVDALQPGDTLTIHPGEYRESVSREDLGSADAETVIRAAQPGTVLLRGDVPAPAFRKLEGYRFVYVADMPGEPAVHVVNELDTLTVIQAVPSIFQVEMVPGSFHHDREAGKLYLSAPDLAPVPEHQYSLSVDESIGLYLNSASRVVIDGLTVTGFNSSSMLNRNFGSLGSVYGIFLYDSNDCVVRNCTAYLNGAGIGLNNSTEDGGRNLITDSMAWANATKFGWGDRGGFSLQGLRMGSWNTIRDCVSFLNDGYGHNIYGTVQERLQKPDRINTIEGCLAWGNTGADFKIKAGGVTLHRIIRSSAEGFMSNRPRPHYCLVGKKTHEAGPDTIVLEEEENLDVEAEFADPINYDYRLQATSRFRGTGPDGTDRGPNPYEPVIVYVRPDGDDSADGRSVQHAVRTIAKAAELLGPGHTLYLEAGSYPLPSTLQLPADVDLRARGTDQVTLTGPATVVAENLSLVRIEVADTVELPELRPAGVSFQELAQRMVKPHRLFGPIVHSATPTTVNLEWWLSVPGQVQLEWGTTPSLGESIAVASAQAGSYSLTGLKPGQTYHLRLTPEQPVEHLQSGRELSAVTITFQTPAEQTPPRTLYVATDGDNANSGTSREQAWRTVQQAANQAQPGDTILIAGGTYNESVYVRASGTPERPITFKAVPGEKVVFDGMERKLAFAFLALGKDHLRFDSLYFKGFDNFSAHVPWAHWMRGLNGSITLYRCDDVQITRCFHNGHGQGYSPGLVYAYFCRDLLIRNNLIGRSMSGGISFTSCPNLVVEHNVFLMNLIQNVSEGMNEPDQPFTLRRNIFTDNIGAKTGVTLFAVGKVESMTEGDNCYWLRIPAEEKNLWTFYGIDAYTRAAEVYRLQTEFEKPPVIEELTTLKKAEYEARFNPNSGSIVANPGFPASEGLPELTRHGTPLFPPDALIGLPDLDFDGLFATHPEVVEKGIGLQPEAFADFHFNQPQEPTP